MTSPLFFSSTKECQVKEFESSMQCRSRVDMADSWQPRQVPLTPLLLHFGNSLLLEFEGRRESKDGTTERRW
jgi:hypothetical protein